MPIETIKCKECGSSDVTEFKSGSYVCGHCEAIFKHIDPSRVTVTTAPEFCRCGNPVTVQCTRCSATMCRRCEARGLIHNRDERYWNLESPMGRGSGYESGDPTIEYCNRWSWSQGIQLITVASGGYRFASRAGESSFILTDLAKRAIIDGWWGDLDARSLESRRFITTARVMSHLVSNRFNGYLCLACVSETAQAAADELAGGELCSNPYCSERAGTECPCCKEPSCEHCLFGDLDPLYSRPRDVGNRDRAPSHLRRWIQHYAVLGGGEEEGVGAVVAAPSVCDGCYGEYRLNEADMKHLVVGGRPLTRGGGHRNIEKAKALAEATSTQIAARWRGLLEAGCQRQAGHLITGVTLPYLPLAASAG